MLIVAVDLSQPPAALHFGPLLIVAPAITAAIAGPLSTALVGVLTLLTRVGVGWWEGDLSTPDVITQLVALVILIGVAVFISRVREMRSEVLMRVRSVAEAAQQAVLWPLPARIGPVRITSLYLAAHEEAKIGGDLYAVARTASGTRLLIGDVRGNGLDAIRDAALLVGAFREASHRHSDLTGLSVTLEESLRRHSRESGGLEDCEETFVTALLLDIPDHASVVQLSDFGHPPPLLIHNGQVTPLEAGHTSPPLGMCWLARAAAIQDVFPFETGDTLLLYTDGVSEARNADGEFYPLSQRVAGWSDRGPQEILSCLHQDLRAYAGGRVGDDAAILAVQRVP